LARALCFQERWDEAEAATRESEEAAGDDIYEAGIWGPTRARVLAHRGDHDEALSIAQRALDILTEHDVFYRGYALTSIADVLVAAGRGAEANEYVAQALQKYEHKGIVPLMEKVRGWQAALPS
jgi:ATP/maltotriose-dependent transcriptional regulator MalT